jgi:hypothetical protein
MSIQTVDRWAGSFDRRLMKRTHIARRAQLFLGGQDRVHSCWVRDVTNVGAGIATKNLSAVPLNFELSFDNFRTIRKCQLIWRNGTWSGSRSLADVTGDR